MLLAVSSDTEEISSALVRRIGARFGAPDTVLVDGGRQLASWRAPGGTQLDATAKWAVDGAIDWAGKPDPAEVQSARGDFVLMAMRPDGILLASGVAGGFRPIYVATHASGAVVASTRLAVVRMAIEDRTSFDLDAICAACVVQARPRPDATPYARIRQVPMGRAWTVRAGTTVRSFSIERPFREGTLESDAAGLAERMRSELVAAVRRATRGTDHLALSVSGGLDSGTIMSLLCNERRTRGDVPAFDAFAVTFDAPAAWDDRPYRRLLSDRWSIPIFEVDPATPALSPKDLLAYLVIDGLPCRAVGVALAAEMARRARGRGAQLVLSGEGGDDVLNGQPGLYGDLLRRGQWVEAVHGVWSLRALPWRSFRRLRSLLQLRTALSPFEPTALRRRRRRLALATSLPWAGKRLTSYLEQVGSDDTPRLSLDATAEERYGALRSLRAFNDAPRLRAQEEIVGGHARRDPFLDDEFLRFVATLPPLALLHDGYKRGLMRESMRGLLPEPLRVRTTKSFIEPAFVRMTMSARGVRVLEDLVDVRMLADLGIVEPKPFRDHYERVAAQPADRGWVHLWAFAAAESFLRLSDDPSSGDASWN